MCVYLFLICFIIFNLSQAAQSLLDEIIMVAVSQMFGMDLEFIHLSNPSQRPGKGRWLFILYLFIKFIWCLSHGLWWLWVAYNIINWMMVIFKWFSRCFVIAPNTHITSGTIFVFFCSNSFINRSLYFVILSSSFSSLLLSPDTALIVIIVIILYII